MCIALNFSAVSQLKSQLGNFYDSIIPLQPIIFPALGWQDGILKKLRIFQNSSFLCLSVYIHHTVQKFITKDKFPMAEFPQSLLSWITSEISLFLLKELKQWKAQDLLIEHLNFVRFLYHIHHYIFEYLQRDMERTMSDTLISAI